MGSLMLAAPPGISARDTFYDIAGITVPQVRSAHTHTGSRGMARKDVCKGGRISRR